jgi:hypothetical protein
MKINRILITLLIVITVLSGFGREYVMKNINWVIKYLTQGGANYAQSEFNFLTNWNVFELNILKWCLTIFFTTYFFLLTYFSINKIFPSERKYQILTIGFYIVILVLSGSVYLVGWMFGVLNDVYHVTRALMGVAQSFIPLMIFYLLFRFMSNEK